MTISMAMASAFPLCFNRVGWRGRLRVLRTKTRTRTRTRTTAGLDYCADSKWKIDGFDGVETGINYSRLEFGVGSSQMSVADSRSSELLSCCRYQVDNFTNLTSRRVLMERIYFRILKIDRSETPTPFQIHVTPLSTLHGCVVSVRKRKVKSEDKSQ